jgi:hypothetical protein
MLFARESSGILLLWLIDYRTFIEVVHEDVYTSMIVDGTLDNLIYAKHHKYLDLTFDFYQVRE